MTTVILAPHPDDELIGCWSLFEAGVVTDVVYFVDPAAEQVRAREVATLATHFNFTPHFYPIGSAPISLLDGAQVYLPSSADSHPDHKAVNSRFRLLPNKTYYSVDLATARNKRVLPNSADKRDALDRFYPSQASLWQYNASYVLFEAFSKTDFQETCTSTYCAMLYGVYTPYKLYTDRAVDLVALSKVLTSHDLVSSGENVLDALVYLGFSNIKVCTGPHTWVGS